MNSIARHWRKYPQHELGAIVDNQLLILDADSPEAIGALYATEEAFDLTPNLVVTTRKGEHHYFKRALGTYAHMDSFNTENEPEKIDIRTGRQSDSGRSIIILPPSTNKTIKINEADYISDLVEVNQDFIDAVFRHNGREAPRVAPERKQASNSFCPSILKISEILSYINPGLGYDDWLKVLMGLHDEFNGSDVGLDLADQWSCHGSNYMGFEEIEYKWRAFIANKKNGITFATVARMASDAGANLKEIASRYDNDGIVVCILYI